LKGRVGLLEQVKSPGVCKSPGVGKSREPGSAGYAAKAGYRRFAAEPVAATRVGKSPVRFG